MAKDKQPLTPAEKVLAGWAMEAKAEQPLMPDWDAEFSASFPNLWVFLTWTTVGQFKKAPGSMSVRADGTGWRIGYHDPTAKRSTAVVATTLMEGLRKLDAALVADGTVWTSTDRKGKGWTERKKS